MREELAQRVALDEDAMQKSWRASVDGTTPLLGPNCPCLSTLHALTTSRATHSTSSMRGVWKDMDSSAQEAGSSRPPKLSSSSASRPRQGLHAGPALLSSHHRGATGLSVSIPS